MYTNQAIFPLDEAPHYKNSLEWWYFTGHLTDINSDRQFGVEYVFFHFNPRNKNDWMMVNVAITDENNKKFYYEYKIEKLDSLLEPVLPINLKMPFEDNMWTLSGQEGNYEMKAAVPDKGFALDLSTDEAKPVVFHNETGYEEYGEYATAGYLSYPRLNTSGSLIVDGEEIDVEGQLWYDRQWNCIGVYQQDVAWDWFSIQFDEINEELMLYQLYNVAEDDYVFGGSLFTAENQYKDIPDDMTLEPLEFWESPDSKVRYPVKWRITIPSWDTDITATAVMPEQELKIRFNALISLYYWEGMCTVEGTFKGEKVSGDSYIEMTNRGIMK